MRRHGRVCAGLAALAAALLLLASCGANPRETILGVWRDERSADTLVFLNDGTLIATTSRPSLVGPPLRTPMVLRYAFLDDRHLKVSARGFGVETAQVWEVVSITRDRLELKHRTTGRATFKKVR